MCDGALFSQRLLNTWLTLGSGDLIPCCFACLHNFCFPYLIAFIWIQEFSSLSLSDSLPNPADGGVSEELRGAWLLLGVKPWHIGPSVDKI